MNLWKTLSSYGRLGRLHILIYHRVLKEYDPLRPDEITVLRFDQHCQWLKRYFNVLPLSQGYHRLLEGSLPPHAVCITFDDGYQDNIDMALPVLKSFDLTATFFIATGFLQNKMMFNDTIIESVRAWDGPISLDNQTINLSNLEGKRQAILQLIKKIKPLSPESREQALRNIFRDKLKRMPTMMSDQGVKQLAQAEMHIGAHTVNHPLLSRINDQLAIQEISESKSYLENISQKPISWFAYPNGRWRNDFNQRHCDFVQQLGFEGAVSTDWGCATIASNPYRLPRFTPWHASAFKFRAKMLQIRTLEPA